MDNYWYISLVHAYPQPSWHVMSVQFNRYYSIIEMEREATEHELLTCDLVYMGTGQFNDEHIQSNINRYERMINK